MKIRLLNEIDLARITTLPLDRQKAPLKQVLRGWPKISYAPIRSLWRDIFNIQPGMFAPVEPTSSVRIEELLRKKCRSDDELSANLAVARGLNNFTVSHSVSGRVQDFYPLALGAGRRVTYWLPMVLSVDTSPLIPFVDPRQSRGLGQEGRRFVFSMMHERIRAADPDYASVRFAVVQFSKPRVDKAGTKRREVVLHTDHQVELFSLDEMERMVGATYALWAEVCAEREMEARSGSRRKATGTDDLPF